MVGAAPAPLGVPRRKAAPDARLAAGKRLCAFPSTCACDACTAGAAPARTLGDGSAHLRMRRHARRRALALPLGQHARTLARRNGLARAAGAGPSRARALRRLCQRRGRVGSEGCLPSALVRPQVPRGLLLVASALAIQGPGRGGAVAWRRLARRRRCRERLDGRRLGNDGLRRGKATRVHHHRTGMDTA